MCDLVCVEVYLSATNAGHAIKSKRSAAADSCQNSCGGYTYMAHEFG